MELTELIEKLNLDLISGKSGLDKSVKFAYVSDLLSDVMGNANAEDVWITLQSHKNILAVAGLKDISAIILINGNLPDEETKQKSEEEGIPILGTSQSAFVTAGRIYELLKSHELI